MREHAAMPVAAHSFNQHPASVRAARDFATSALTQWNRDDLIEQAALLVSEVTTNAIYHGHSAIQLIMWPVAAGGIRVEAHDHAPVVQLVARHPSPCEETGRGLDFVDQFSARWGWFPTSSGKCVWFELE
jgi:anti-sigma regulatory factor (Ser/Thr protein kinase)